MDRLLPVVLEKMGFPEMEVTIRRAVCEAVTEAGVGDEPKIRSRLVQGVEQAFRRLANSVEMEHIKNCIDYPNS